VAPAVGPAGADPPPAELAGADPEAAGEPERPAPTDAEIDAELAAVPGAVVAADRPGGAVAALPELNIGFEPTAGEAEP
jgi:hypothetical protein